MTKPFMEYLAEAIAKMYVAKLCELPIKDIENPEDPEQNTYPMRETLDIFMNFMKTNIKSKDKEGEKQDHRLLSSAIIESTKPGIGKFYNNDYFNAYTLLKLIKDESNSPDDEKVFMHVLQATIVKMLENHANVDNNDSGHMENADLARQHANDVINLLKTYFDPIPVQDVSPTLSDDSVDTSDNISADNTELYSTLLDLAIDILSATPDSVNPSTDEILLDLSIDILSSIKTSTEQETSIIGGKLSEKENYRISYHKGGGGIGALLKIQEYNVPNSRAITEAKIKAERDKIAAEAEAKIKAERDKIAAEAEAEAKEAFDKLPEAAIIKRANPFAVVEGTIADTQKAIFEEIQKSLGPENKMTYNEIHSKLLEIITDALKYHIKGEDSDKPSKEGIQATLRIFETYMNRQVYDFIEGENITVISLITIFKESEKMRTFLKDILHDEFILFLDDPNHMNQGKWSEFANAIATNTISKLEAKLDDYVATNNPLEELYTNMKNQGFTSDLINKKKDADEKNTTLGLEYVSPHQQGGYSKMYSPKSLQKTLKTYSNFAFRNIRNIDSSTYFRKNTVSKKHRRHN